MTKRLSWLVVVLGAGCVFTPRPMIPFSADGGADFTNVGDDAGRSAASDASVPPPVDGSTGYAGDAAATDATPPSPMDSRCQRAGDAGDGGYVNQDGQPCDPTAAVGDAGAGDVPDAACDAATDAACDGAVTTGLARGQR